MNNRQVFFTRVIFVLAAYFFSHTNAFSQCSNTTAPGTISAGSAEYKCGSFDPASISITAASGGTGTISYQWESSTNNSTWADIVGATTQNYNPPVITQSTWYRRKSMRSGCTVWGATSASILKSVILPANNITISNLTVGSVIDHALVDVANVSLTVSWSAIPAGATKINVTIGNKTRAIDIGTLTSPQTLNFMVNANGLAGSVTANWDILTSPNACESAANFTPPSSSKTFIGCSILYLCGLDKPYDGYPFDHGLIAYLSSVSTSSVTPVLTKNEAGMGTYDVNNQTTPVAIELDNYGLIVVSPTTEAHLSPTMKTALNTFKGSLLVMNYESTDDLGMTPNSSYANWGESFATSTSTVEKILDYGNINPTGGYLMTGGDYRSNANASLWANTTTATNRNNGIYYSYPEHSLPTVSTTHGKRVYLGLHMNGIYANAQNGGALPAPVQANFNPINHLTIKGKEIMENAIVQASVCTPENCSNGIDDDGDGLVDCYDPDCNVIINGEFDNGITGWSFSKQPGVTSVISIDNTNQVSGINAAKVSTSVTTGTDYHIQLIQSGLSIVSGKSYKLHFRAKASSPRNVAAYIQLDASPYTDWGYNTYPVSTTAQYFSTDFTVNASSVNGVSLKFNLGAATGDVWIDDVFLVESCAPTLDCSSIGCVSASLITNSDFTSATSTGWTAPLGELILAGGSSTGNYAIINNSDLVGDYTVYQDVVFSANKPYLFTGFGAKHVTGNNSKVYLEFYNGTTLISKSNDFFISHNYNGNFQEIPPFAGITPSGTTKIRVVGYANGTALKFDNWNLYTCVDGPIITSTTPGSICGSGSVILSATASTGTINWYAAATGGASLGTGTSFTTPIISSSTTYYVDAIANGCTSQRTPVNAIVASQATITSTTPAGRCGAGTVTLGATTSAGTINWYAASTGGTSLGTGTSFTTPSISTNTTYYVDATNAGCTSANRTAVIATINTTPTIASTTPASRCGTGTLTLGATASAGTINWYAAATGGASLGTGTSFTTPSISATTTYYVDATNAGCTTANRTAVIATVTTLPTVVSTTPGSRCDAGTVTLGATASAGTINWYAAATGGASLGTGTSFTTPSISATTTYYAEANNSGCLSTARTAVVATIGGAPTVSSTTPGSRCGAGTVTLGATTGAGTINWYAASTGGASLGTGTSFTTPSISATTTYYVDVTSGACITPTRTAVIATINTTPTIASTTPASRCGTGTVTLGATASAGTINWYAAATGGASLGTGTSFTTPSISANTTYYVDATNAGCTTANRTAVIATVTTLPTVASTTPGSRCDAGTVTLSATASTGTINWYSAATGGAILFTGTSFTTPSISATTTYYAEANNSGCLSTARTAVIATIGAAPTVSSTTPGSRCGAGTVTLGATASAGTINWYAASTGGTSLGTGTSYTTASISATTTYYLEVVSGGCISLSRTPIIATINPIPTIAITGANGICIGGTTALSPTSGGSWVSNNPTIASINNAGQVTGLAAGSATFTFTSSAGCPSAPSSPITIGSSVTGTINYNGSQCFSSGKTISINTSGGTTPFTYAWTGPSGFTASTSSVTIPLAGTYNVAITDALGCIDSKTATIYGPTTVNITAPNTTICQGQAVVLTANVTNVSYLWGVNAGNAVTQSVTVSPTSNTTYGVTVTNTNSCTSTASILINVNAKPVVSITGSNPICQGNTTQLSPNTGGVWISNNPTIASVSNAGLVTSIAAGSATFTFTNSTTNCNSDATLPLTINPLPVISLGGPNQICINTTTQLNSTLPGTWTSSNTAVATVNNAGLVTGVSSGSVTFSFLASGSLCPATNTIAITVSSKPNSGFSGANTICIGDATALFPTTGGTWTSSNPSVASVTNGGVVTAISAGTATFLFTNAQGCAADATGNLTVNARPTVTVTGPATICVGSTTTLSPTTGGIWTSNNPAIATVNNLGVVTGVASGSTTFKFTSSATTCTSDNSAPITINARPAISFTGPKEICIGSTSSIAPTSGGVWVSSNPSIATINNSGIITALAEGTVNFVFTSNATGCQSANSPMMTVYAKVPVTVTGASLICIGSTTSLSPSTGGIWSSSNPAIATVSNDGIVTGIGLGTATFTFTQTSSGCTSDATSPITVSTKPGTVFNGPTSICIGSNTSIQPSTGGTWVSNNPTVAVITNGGIITGLAQGIATFTFTAASGCVSDPSPSLVVNGRPTINFSGSTSICIGQTSTITSGTTGTWESNNPSVAVINNSGVITAISAGTVTFKFTDGYTGCVSNNSGILHVNDKPVVFNSGPNSLCIGETTNMTPSTQGMWTSSNNAVAAITNNGEVTALSAGTANLKYMNTTSGCESDLYLITVKPRPDIQITGPSNICIGSSSSLSPSTGGTWISTHPSIASVNNSGIVVGLAAGTARFKFTLTSTGCTSLQSAPITVNGKPITSISGPSDICIGGVTNLLPNSGGSWVSLNPSIATVTANGIVTGVAQGIASFQFTESGTNCVSDPNDTKIIVTAIQPPSVTGQNLICLGYKTTLSPAVGVIWTSTNPAIATVSNDGIVTGIAPGKVSFYYTEVGTGCKGFLPNDAVTVISCIDPDFNVTFVNKTVEGNVSTNDEIPGNKTYGSEMLKSKPVNSAYTFILNYDGKYFFTANTPGQYVINIPVCIEPMIFNCPYRELVITVIDPNAVQNQVVANTDIATLYTGQSINIKTTSNDKCMDIGGCTLNMSTMAWIDTPAKGDALKSNGNTDFTTWPSKFGLDTIGYLICNSTSAICQESKQIITINALNALNSTVAADDYFYTAKTVSVTGNVKINDSDPENNLQTVVAQGSAASPISIAQGTYFIDANGNLTFNPIATFSGPVDIVYTICDNNASGSYCAKATAHILVMEDMSLRIRVYLEGALLQNRNLVSLEGKPLMRDELRVNPFNGKNYIPAKDPYKIPTPDVNIVSKYTHVLSGQLARYEAVTDSAAVFGVTGQNAIVDWVFVELRNKNNKTQVLTTRSGLLQRDGDVVDIDGVSALQFAGISLDSFYVVVRHRNHLGAMSQKVSSGSFVDFTNPNTPVFNFGNTLNNGMNYTGLSMKSDVIEGYTALWAGDFDGNKKVKFTNPSDDQNYLFYEVLVHPDNLLGNANFDNVIGYYQGDFNMNGKSKYDNPNDDKNFLFGQIVLYPLNVNYLSNFNFLIEQIP